jgi:hypothetical protein
MKFVVRSLLLAASLGSLGGCGTDTDIVSIGPDMYMLGRLGGMTDYSGSKVKARLYAEASEFCTQKGRAIYPLNSTGQDASIYTYASAEVQFRCLKPDDSGPPK